MTPALEVHGLTKSFTNHRLGREIRGCRDVAFTLSHGEFVGITGRSGSGKSTVLKLVWRSYLPQAGSILYDSAAFGPVDVAHADERRMLHLRRTEIGFVSQFLVSLPRTTALDLVERAVHDRNAVDDGSAVNGKARSAAEAMLSHFEIDPALWDVYVSTLSGGEKLRVNIARAMVTHPRLLLLDEPTASLDAASKQRVRQVLERLKSEGATILGIFHDLAFMEGLCDRSYRMSDGVMVGDFTNP
jgi:alpha-D-ribose 1-methylphosphonate 5-triphosphate synthase subunit PhnL